MPLFEYRCPECSRTREVLVHDSDQQVRCSYCKRYQLMEKLPAASNFQIKGFSAANGYAEGK